MKTEPLSTEKLASIIGKKDIKVVRKMLSDKDIATLVKYQREIRFTNTMGHGFWIGDKKHKTLYANSIYQKITGYPLKECIGQQADFCFDDESKRTIDSHHELRKTGIASKYEAAYITKKGKLVPVLVVGAPTESKGTYGTHIDLTDVMKTREQQQISEQIIKNSTEAIVVLDKSHKVKLWNTGATKIFGYKEDEILNKKLKDLIIPKELKEENQKIINKVGRTGILYNIETKRLRKNGEKIDVSLSMTKVTDSKGKPKGFLLIYKDITHKKSVNTELQKRFEAIQDAYKELGLQKRQADYIYEITDMAVSTSTMDSLSKLIVSATSMLTKCDGAVLRIFEKNKKQLKLSASIGVDKNWSNKGHIAFENSLAEEAFETKRPIIIQDIDSSAKHKSTKLLKTHKFKTLILLPLIVAEELLGTLSLYSSDPGRFRLIETEFLEQFGKQCSMAIFIKNKRKSKTK